jgi:hypothetical protein
MIGPGWTRGRLALLAAVLLLAGGATLLAASGVLSPRTVSSAVLGEQWQCSSFVLMTVCTQAETIAPVAQDSSRNPEGGQPPDDATAALCAMPGREGSTERRSIKFEILH